MSDATVSLRPVPRAGVLSIAPYVPGKATAPVSGPVYKLSSNETPLGASPRATEAYRAVATHLEAYPDGSATRLREAIGQRYGIDPDRIVCGAGSDEILNLIAQAYLGPGDEAIYSEYGFLVYRIAIQAAGATPVVAPERTLCSDVDALLASVTERTRVLFLANPNNPTGTFLPVEAVRRLHAGLPPHVLLVLDAAYAEYVEREDYEPGFDLVASSDNVVMTRTFSKIYGLAGIRLGWCVGPAHVVDALNRIRGPFNVSAAAIEAGAAAVHDRDFVEAARAHNDRWLPWLTREISALGLTVTPSVGNFVLVHFPLEPGSTAREADSYLLSRGLILRRLEGYGLPGALRLTVGSEAANRAVVGAVRDFLALSVSADGAGT